MACEGSCEGCGEKCDKRPLKETLRKGASVKKVVGVISGKGGVGKSLVTALLACGAQRKGLNVAVLDADITGPSIPATFGLRTVRAESMGEEKNEEDAYLLPVKSATGIQLMSMNFLLPQENSPVVWRGPVISGAVRQFWTDVLWQDVDLMLVDCPPGTGDVPLTVFQSLPVDGIVVVSSPQQLVRTIVEKAVNMAHMMNIPIFGMVENMSYAKCPDCGREIKIFGESNIDAVAREFDVPVLAKIPLEPNFTAMIDSGNVEELRTEFLENVLDVILP